MVRAYAGNDVQSKTRRDAFAELEALRAEVSTQNHDLTEMEAESFADQLVREAIDGLVEQGKLVFERDL